MKGKTKTKMKDNEPKVQEANERLRKAIQEDEERRRKWDQEAPERLRAEADRREGPRWTIKEGKRYDCDKSKRIAVGYINRESLDSRRVDIWKTAKGAYFFRSVWDSGILDRFATLSRQAAFNLCCNLDQVEAAAAEFPDLVTEA